MTVPASAGAEIRLQDPVPRAPAPGSPGWVGLQVEFVATGARQARSGDYRVVIADVVRESPAWTAGVQPGDTLLQINGAPASPHSFEELRSSLRSGDVIELAVRRPEGDRRLEVVAADRPTFVFGPAPLELELRIDSLRTAILRDADSLRRAASARREGTGIGVLGLGTDSSVTVLELSKGRAVAIGGGGTVSVVAEASSDGQAHITSWSFRIDEPGTPQAFETLVVHTPQTDSVRASILRLKAELDRIHRVEQKIEQEVASGISVAEVSNEPLSVALDEVRALQAALISRLGEREAELRKISRAELEASARAASGARVRAPSVASVRVGGPPDEIVPVQPVTPYLSGRSYLAGARVTDMNEGLAEYFEVSSGVLVTEVNAETPAADAGLEPGDVIVSVDDRNVVGVAQLRSRLARRWAGATLTVVRRGEELSLTLSR
jgi:membrane-associated protease RseP (regulator of RpoE activity)